MINDERCESKINVCHLEIGTEHGLLDIIFLTDKKGVTFLNEISEVLKSTREMSGVSIEEVSKDLEIPILVLKQIEDGNIGAFKDIFELKKYISDYSKYLGLNPDEVIDEFNEYMFEATSKIPMAEIEKAAKNIKDQDDKKVSSPYTKAVLKTSNKKFLFMIILIVVLIIIAIIWSIKQITIGNVKTNIISYLDK